MVLISLREVLTFFALSANTQCAVSCLQNCVYDPVIERRQHEAASDDARRKLISAAVLSVVFMVKPRNLKSFKLCHYSCHQQRLSS